MAQSKKLSLSYALKKKKFRIGNSMIVIYVGDKKPFVKDRDTYHVFYVISRTSKGLESFGLAVKAEGRKIKKLGIFNLVDKKGRAVIVEPKDLPTDDFVKVLVLASKNKNNPKLRKLFLREASEESGKKEEPPKQVIYFAPPNQADTVMKLSVLLGTILTVIGLFITLYVYYKGFVRVKLDEQEAIKVEQEINKKLFQGQSANYPPLEEYADLIEAVKALLTSKNLNGLLVYGPPGTGKTYMVRRTLYFNNVDALYFKGGTINLDDFVSILYRYRKGKVLVFDDFDTGFRDQEFVNTLKAAMDSYPKRIITLPQAASYEGGQNGAISLASIPERFVFESKIIIITNRDFHQLPKAILSRSFPVRVDFSSEQLAKIIEKVLKYLATDLDMQTKLKVLNRVKDMQKNCKFRLDFRVVGSAFDLYRALGDKWEQIFRQIFCKSSK